MSWAYRTLLRSALFQFDSEFIHNFTLSTLGRLSARRWITPLRHAFAAPSLPIELFGLKFPNPVGLAAGMDKRATALPIWERLGFGFTELGGVTWLPQSGNPSPRMFRLVQDEALINRMGFNNPGAEAMATTLATWKERGLWPSHPVAINLGKSKLTPLAQAAEDYARSFRALRPYADFFVVNVSSPNTPNLRELQDRAALDEILAALAEVEGVPKNAGHPRKPILVKIAPDLSFTALDQLLEILQQRRIAGIVATNTTIRRPAAEDRHAQRIYAETGGLSGRPLRDLSTQIIRHIFERTDGKLPIIGVGGIFTAEDALAKIRAGASLVQVYTGLVYEGPGITRDIVAGLQSELVRGGWRNLQEIIGLGTSLGTAR